VSAPPTYCIDASSLIEGWERKYPVDVVPGLWGKLGGLVAARRLISPDEVKRELQKKSDGVVVWAKEMSGLFAPLDEALQGEVASILAAFPRLVDSRRGRSGADPFVIALARVRKATVVTEEALTGKATGPRIPDVCEALKVPYVRILGLIRQEKWTFG
jgi:hypothetical protein